MPQCQHPECTSQESTTACFYPDNETEEPNYYYCSNHATEHNFCYYCGQFTVEFADFWGGTEGLCETCDELTRAELGEFDDDEEFDDRYAYYG